MDLKQLMIEAIEGTIEVHKYAVRNDISYTFAKYELHSGECLLCILDDVITSLLSEEVKNSNHCPWMLFYGYMCDWYIYTNDLRSILRLEEWKQSTIKGELNMYFYSIDRED